ncbi:SpaA isopeptide-forming pilin-related protein [Streptococcus equinus]|uniref:SpaA isopeptide-forming pilin-related protein n=1 Tax=Streptococcus equinus TaxID=1335 RepID=UPI003BF91DC4
MVKLWAKLAILIKKRVQDSIIAKIALALSVVIVFCTTYLLILPALTISTGNSAAVFQSQDSSSSQVESTTTSSQENNQAENSSQTTSTESSQEKKYMSQAGTLSAETSDVTVNVSYEDNTFSEPVQLKVKPVEDTSAIDNKLTTLLSESKQELSQAHSYDISFVTDDGREVEPSKDVKVSMNFKNDLSTSDDKQAGWKLYHFVDNDVNQVQDLTESTDTDIKETGDGAVESIDFKSNTFSTYTLAGVTYADFSGYLTGYTYDEKTVQKDLSTEELTVSLKLTFNINQANLAKEKRYYLALPDDTSIGKDIKLETEYTGRDKNNVDAFKYQFKKDNNKYYLLITFLDSYVANMGNGVQSNGYINYEAVFGLTHETSQSGYTVKFSDGITIEIPADKITKNYDLSTSKTGKVSYDGDTPYIDYTVTVDSKYGTPGKIDLADTLTAAGISIAAVDNVSITKSTYTGDSSNVTGTETVSASPKFDKSSKKWTLTLPQLTSGGTDSNGKLIGHFYTISYRYKMSGLSAGDKNQVKVDNTVNATSKDNQDKREANSSTSVTLKLNDVKKTGEYKDGKIKWTITVNSNGNNLYGAILKDDFLKKTQDLTISPDNKGYRIYYDKNGNVDYIKFTGNPNRKSYTITYTTDAKNSSWDKKDITNTVILDDDGNTDTKDDQTSDSETESVPGEGDLEKSFLGEEDTNDIDVKTLSWLTKIKMPSSGVLKKDTNFRDFLTDPYNQNSEVHWYTKAQLQDLYKNLVKIFGEGKFTLEARQKNWGGYVNYEDLDANTQYTEYQIILTADFKSDKDVTIQYQSTAKLNGGANLDFWNKVTSENHSSQAKAHHTDNPNVVKMDGDENQATTQKTSNDGTVVWKIKVNLSDNAKNLKVTDRLPSGVHLKELVFGRHWSQTKATISDKSISATTGQYEWGATNMKVSGKISSNNVVTLNFSPTDGRTLKESIGGNNDFWLTFTTAYDNLPEAGKKVTATLTNTVSAVVDGKDYGSDSQTQIVTFGKDKNTPSVKPITKTGSWDNTNRNLHYSLSINPNADDLVDGADKLTLTDVLNIYGTDISLALNHGSVKLYYADSGKEVPTSEWSWKVSSTDNGWGNLTSTLTIGLKDSTAYTLKYDYVVTKQNPNSDGAYWPKNSATLSGVSGSSTNITTSVAWAKIGTDAGIDTEKAYTINKVDSDNYGKGLAGAVFTVYKYDGDCDDSNDEVVGRYVSDENGHISISKTLLESGTCYQVYVPFWGWVTVGWSDARENFEDNQMYYFKETSAPAGYELPENPDRYYFYYAPDLCDTYDEYYKKIYGAVNLAKTNGTAFVENKKIKQANLTVKKEWLRADGSKTEHSDGSITYDLIQVATDSQGDSTETVYKSGETLTHDDDWTRTYKGLPVSGKNAAGNEVDYKYYVRETPVSGYDTSYSNGETTPDNHKPSIMATDSEDGQITIKNKVQKQKQYNLPETGGSGVKMHYVLGAALVLLTTGLIILKAYKTYQAGGDS